MKKLLLAATLLGSLTASALQYARNYTVDGKPVALKAGERVVDLAQIYPDGFHPGRKGTRWADVETVVSVPAAGMWRLHCQNEYFGELYVNDRLVAKVNGPTDEWKARFVRLEAGDNRIRYRTRAGSVGWYCGVALDDTLDPSAPPMHADFSKEVRPLRRELHSSGFGPTICSQTAQDLADVKSMGFKCARTHDWAGVNSNQRVCDYFHIFPLMHLDAKDPKNYVFGPTDYLLKRTREEAGLDVFFRLGTTIEHSGYKVHFNAVVPDDFDKVAETFAATVRHYNRGWANGYEWGIKYWEIWNEPEGIENMWCPPDGITDDDFLSKTAKRAEYRAKFVKFFVTVLKRLKAEFGDTIKVGGPALIGYNQTWLTEILQACKDAAVAPDFISWHGYTSNPRQFVDQAELGRKLCDGFGFTKCELIVNEWHYFDRALYNWADMQRCSDPKVKARIWEGPDSHNGIRSSCFTLATLANLQRSKLDQAYFYGCRHTGPWGFKDELQRKYKVYYALKLFGDIVRTYKTVCASVSEGTITTLAVKDAAGRKGLLVVDYGGSGKEIEVPVLGVSPSAKVSATVLSHACDLERGKAAFANGVLTLDKPDYHSAAFFVKFEE